MSSLRVVWADIGASLVELMASVRGHATIVAPFITKVAFKRVIEAAAPNAELLVITRWAPRDVALGVSDTSIIDLITERQNGRLFLHPSLHAKFYVADGARALVGSANVTEPALGLGDHPNREVLVDVAPVPTGLLVFLRRLQIEAVPASQEVRREIERLAERVALPTAAENTKDDDPVVAGKISAWFPTLRHPERLYRLYRSMDDASSQDEREAALDDLAELSLREGLEEEHFRSEIARRLRSYAQILEFDEFVKRARRFGELTDWLKARDWPLAEDHEACQRQVQTLIRWLLFFFPDRYRLNQPNYSEIFGRLEEIRSSDSSGGGLRRES